MAYLLHAGTRKMTANPTLRLSPYVGLLGFRASGTVCTDAIVNVRFSYIPALQIGIPYAEGDLVKYK